MRKLQPDLIKYFDDHLANNALAAYAIEHKAPRTLMVEAAKTLIGVREKTGHNDGVIVELLQKTVGGIKGYSYCMYAVQSVLAYAEHKLNIESKVHASGSCLDVWDHTDKSMRVQYTPLQGAIIIWKHMSGNYTGHTGLILSCDEDSFFAIEANTGSGLDINSKVVSNGDGIYMTKRSRRPVGEMQIQGFIKPF